MSGSGPSPLPNKGGYPGPETYLSGGSPFNAVAFLVDQMIAGKAWCMVVQVKGSSGSGGVSPVGTVDVQPMVDQVDGFGNKVPHGTIYQLPFFRLQGGMNAIIIDPAVGDIGIAVFAQRDISVVKATRAVAGPGSARQNDWADGLYLGGVLNGAPSQYVRFHAGGVDIVSPATVKIEAQRVEIDAVEQVVISGQLFNNGVNVGNEHRHIDTQPGAGISGPPEP